MTGLVLDLQKDALDSNVGLADLLRKAHVVSRKLRVDSVQRWINLELEGYYNVTDNEWEMANYRDVYGRLHFHNPFQGMIPARVGDERLSEMLQKAKVFQSISEIEDLLVSRNPELRRQFTNIQSQMIRDIFQTDFEPWLILSRQQLVGIIDAVRTKILDWALDLEAKGILGEGMAFSKNEQQVASQISYSTVNNIGSMNNSQLQLHSSGFQNMANQDGVELSKKLIDALDSVFDALKLSQSAAGELRAEIETIKVQLGSPKPKFSVLKECFLSTKAILEGATGNILASGIASQIPTVVAALGAAST